MIYVVILYLRAMAKKTKTQISATIDTWVYNWVLQQPGKLSTTINEVLKAHIVSVDEEPKKQKRLFPMNSKERKVAFEAHMKRLNHHLDSMEESE